MKLSNAVLCLDCEEIYEVSKSYTRCPSCFSESYILIHKYIQPMASLDLDFVAMGRIWDVQGKGGQK
jgi:Zn finger protein HypA/HybF involved in hydrogenase expression